MDKVRIGILDNHQAIIDGYQYRLQGQPDLVVVGTAQSGEGLEELLRRETLDVLLLDIHVPTSAADATEYPMLQMLPRFVAQYPDLNILVISMLEQGVVVRSALNAGATGYVLKDDAGITRQLPDAVRSAAQGNLVLSRKAHEALRRLPQEQASITKRQREILQILADEPNLTAAEVGQRLGITSSTVRNLLSNAYLRLGVRHRGAAVQRAQQLGLIRPGFSGIAPAGEKQ